MTTQVATSAEEPQVEKKVEPHFHVDNKGVLHKCYHQCRRAIADWGFWLGVTVSFPLEHFLWEKVWPFYKLTELFGL